jgi:hypothetical protein
MKSSHRISGIYDYRTIQHLNEHKINHFSFDLRPRSLNFIQEYRLLEILEKTQLGTVYLQFQNEKPYIVERIYNNCLKAFSGNVYVEYSGHIDNELVVGSKIPFLAHVENKELGKLYINDLCQGHVFSYEFLKDLQVRGEFLNWVTSYYQIFNAKSFNLLQILNLDWDSDVFPTLFEYFDFDLLSLPINNKIEVCYRNVDLNKVSTHLKTI